MSDSGLPEPPILGDSGLPADLNTPYTRVFGDAAGDTCASAAEVDDAHALRAAADASAVRFRLSHGLMVVFTLV
jgi:hypothetical protein